jgi:hypothetical protein
MAVLLAVVVVVTDHQQLDQIQVQVEEAATVIQHVAEMAHLVLW